LQGSVESKENKMRLAAGTGVSMMMEAGAERAKFVESLN